MQQNITMLFYKEENNYKLTELGVSTFFGPILYCTRSIKSSFYECPKIYYMWYYTHDLIFSKDIFKNIIKHQNDLVNFGIGLNKNLILKIL